MGTVPPAQLPETPVCDCGGLQTVHTSPPHLSPTLYHEAVCPHPLLSHTGGDARYYQHRKHQTKLASLLIVPRISASAREERMWTFPLVEFLAWVQRSGVQCLVAAAVAYGCLGRSRRRYRAHSVSSVDGGASARTGDVFAESSGDKIVHAPCFMSVLDAYQAS